MSEARETKPPDLSPQTIAGIVLRALLPQGDLLTRVEPDGRWTLVFFLVNEEVAAEAAAAGIRMIPPHDRFTWAELGPAVPPLVPRVLEDPSASPFPLPISCAILEVLHRGGDAWCRKGVSPGWSLDLGIREPDPELEALLADAGFLPKPPDEDDPENTKIWSCLEEWLPRSERDAARAIHEPRREGHPPGAELAPRRALFRAIVAAPEDDAPRLAYADHCAVSGDHDRAELIRLHCAFERMSPEDPAYTSSYRRLTQLADQHLARWAGDAVRVVTPASLRRGFVESVRGSPGDVQKAASTLLDLVPVLDLAFVDAESHASHDVEQLADHPLLARLRRLDFADGTSLGAGPLRTMLTSPRVKRLATVSLFDGECTPETARVIAEHLPDTVRSVGFVGLLDATFDDASAAMLAASPRLARVEELVLYNCNLGPDGARALAGSRCFGALRKLRLGLGQHTRNRILAEGAESLARSTTLGALRFLDLDFNDIGDAGLAVLADARGLPSLTALRLQANELSDESVQRLLSSPRGHALESLDLSHNHLSVATIESLVRVAPRALRRLWLMGNELGDAGAKALAESPWVGQLEELNIDGMDLTDAGATALARSPYLAAVPRLACAMQSRLSQASVTLLESSLPGCRWRRRFSEIRMLG